MRILIADDDKFFLSIAEEILTEAGHDIILASNGREALEKSVTEKPEMIILDVVMPQFLGTELCERLRKFSRTANVPIILVSGGSSEVSNCDVTEEFMADGFLSKPFKADELVQQVEQLAAKARQNQKTTP